MPRVKRPLDSAPSAKRGGLARGRPERAKRVEGRLHVAFALIERRGRYLICQRSRGTHLAGYWEFPGGKRKPFETWEACLRREIREELGVELRNVRPFTRLHHRYPGRFISFKVFRCRMAGTPKALQIRRFRWVGAARLRRFRFPPADRDLIDLLACAGRNKRAIIKMLYDRTGGKRS